MLLIIFVLPAQVLLALLALAKPQTATLLLAALAPAYLIKFSIAEIPTNLFEISILTVFSFSLTQNKFRHKSKEALRLLPTWTILFIALFVLSSLISTFISPHIKTSLGILKSWIFVPLLLGWLIYTFGLADKKNNFHAHALRSLVLSGLFVSLFGLTQINQIDRVRSIYDVSNSLALYLTPLLVISFYLTIANHQVQKITYLLSAIILASALIATQSVSGIIAATMTMLVGVIICCFSKRPYKNKKTVIYGLVLFALFTAASFFVIATTGRLNYLIQPQSDPSRRNSISVRLQLWDISLELIKNNPYLGIGLGTFEPAYQKTLHARFSKFNDCKITNKNCIKPIAEFVYRDPHNWPLSFWLNTGLIGLIGFVLINVITIWKAVTQLRSMPYSASRTLVAATTLALASLLLYGLTDTIYWKNDLSALHWMLIALLTTAALNSSGCNKR